MGELWQSLKPAMGLVVVQLAFAGVNILYKLAINDGMDMSILVAYRYLFASAFLGPLAFFLEKKSRPSLTWKLLMQAFFCGLFGGSLAQNLYVVGVKLTSATFATAMNNLIPGITFVMAVIFSLEKLGIKSVSGQAKVLGTIVGIGGAMTLTFYKGADINLFSSKFDLIKSSQDIGGIHQQSGNHVIGSLLVVVSCCSYAIWLIIQAKVSQANPCLYSTTALMCFMAAVQSIVYALCMDRDWDHWRLGFDIRLLTVVYVGVVASALILTLLSWCIKQKGPLYASVFNPLMVVIVAFLGSLLLDEKLHVGSIMGAALIVIGLYMVLWGKGKEAVKVAEMPTADETINVVIEQDKASLQEENEPDKSKDNDPSLNKKDEEFARE